MKETLAERLERKRAELGIEKSKFATQLKLGKTERGAVTYYAQILRGVRSFPRKRYELAARILGCKAEELAQLTPVPIDPGRKIGMVNQIKLNSDDLLYLAEIAKAAGAELPLSLLLQHLPHKPKP